MKFIVGFIVTILALKFLTVNVTINYWLDWAWGLFWMAIILIPFALGIIEKIEDRKRKRSH